MTRPKAELIISQFVRSLDTLGDDVAAEAMMETRDFLRDELRRNAQKGGPTGLNKRTGALLNSIRTYLKGSGGRAELTVGMKFYGWVHDRGAVIEAKNAPYLRFQLPNGAWVQTKSVTLPARNWATDAVQESRKRFPAFIRQAVHRRMR